MIFANKINRSKNYLNWYFSDRLRLKAFKNKHQGQDCFIMGNGPSLNKMDLTLLNDYHTFGMNKIFLIFKRVELELSYLVSVNDLVIEQSKEEFEKMNCPVFLSYSKSQNVIDKKDHIHRLYTQFSKAGMSWLFTPNMEEPIFEGCTVTFVALQLAYYMGFERVFLVGVDHNFKQTGKPHEKQTMTEDDANHFDPNYFKGNAWHLADLRGSEVSYHLADYAYQSTGRKIYDATVEGKLDIYEKISYEDAIRMARKK